MSDLLTWLNAEHLAAQQTYQAERDPYHEGAVDALDRVIARVEGNAPVDDVSIERLQDIALLLQAEKDAISIDLGRAREKYIDLALAIARCVERWRSGSAPGDAASIRNYPGTDGVYIEGHKHGFRDCADELTRALDALEAGR